MSVVTREEVESDLRDQHDAGRRRIIEPDWAHYCTDQLPASPYAIQGQLSWWEAQSRTRWIDPAESEDFLSEEEPWTIDELSRKWLTRHVTRSSPFRAGAYTASYLLELPSPIFYVGGRIESDDLAYVDLSSAYWQIYSGTTYDPGIAIRDHEILILPGRIDLDAEEMDWFRDDKRARNGVIGMARMRWRTVARFGRMERTQASAPTQSPGLWGYVALVLGAVALEARDQFGAVAVLTDGYVVPGHRAEELIRYLHERWHLDARVAGRGPSILMAHGRYRIGKKKSARLGRIPGDHFDNLVTLNRAQRDSLAKWRREA